MKHYTFITEGLVAELDGKYWGLQRGKIQESDKWSFGPIENAAIIPHDSKGFLSIEKLSGSRLLTVKKVVNYEVGIDPGLLYTPTVIVPPTEVIMSDNDQPKR